jgi:hypothetical protein
MLSFRRPPVVKFVSRDVPHGPQKTFFDFEPFESIYRICRCINVDSAARHTFSGSAQFPRATRIALPCGVPQASAQLGSARGFLFLIELRLTGTDSRDLSSGHVS